MDAEYAAGLFMIPGTPSKLLTLHDKHFPTVCVYAKIQRLCVLILYTTSDRGVSIVFFWSSTCCPNTTSGVAVQYYAEDTTQCFVVLKIYYLHTRFILRSSVSKAAIAILCPDSFSIAWNDVPGPTPLSTLPELSRCTPKRRQSPSLVPGLPLFRAHSMTFLHTHKISVRAEEGSLGTRLTESHVSSHR